MQPDAHSTQPNPSRRKFLKSAAAASVGTAMVGTVLVGGTLPAGAHQGADETIKVALVGCGGRGTGAAVQALSTLGPVKLWAMADAFDDRLQVSLNSLKSGVSARYDRQQSKGFGQAVDVPPQRQYVGLDAYRKAIDSGVDVVILTGPPGFRPQQFAYAVSKGKHVFMEKPLATDAVGVRQILASAKAAKQKNLKVGVGLQRHHQESYQEALRRLHDGAIGQLLALRCYWNTGPPAKTPYARDGGGELMHQVRNWYFFDWLSGDHICEQHIHNLDVCNWIKRGHPIEAHGLGGRQVRTGKEYGNIFDHHAVEFTYADGTKLQSQCRQIPGCFNSVSEHAVGTDGTAELSSTRASLSSGGKEIWRPQRKRGVTKVNAYQVEHDVLFAAIRNNTPHNEAENGALSTMTAILGRLATYSGQLVSWDEAFHSDIRLTSAAESWDAEPPIRPAADGRYAIAVPGVTKVV